MAKLTEDELIDIVDNLESQAKTVQSNIERQNRHIIRRYNAEPYGNEVDGRSQVVSNDVKDLIESDMPSLTRTFLGAGSIMKFIPTNPTNEAEVKEAEEKTAYVDWLIRSQENSFRTQYGFLKDIDLLKFGALKYYIEDTEKVEEQEFKNLDDIELLEVKEDLESKPFYSDLDIELEEENDDGTFNIKFRVKTKRQEVKIVGVPTESFLISPGATSEDDAFLVGDEILKTRGELLAEGYDKKLIAELPTSSYNDSSTRVIRFNDEGLIEQKDFREWSNQYVQISDLYVKVDYDNDGIAERRHIIKSGSYILENEPFDHVPYAIASALLAPHKAIGNGRGEQVEKYQEVKTALTRQMLDNGYMVNNPKKAVNANVNLDDALDDAIGGVVRVAGDNNPNQHIGDLVVPFVGDKSLLLIQHMDQLKAATVGNQLSSQGLNADQLGKETATRFEGVEKAAKGKIELVARIIAEVGYRKLYSGIAWLVGRYQDFEQEFSVLGKPLKTNPSKWRYDSQIESQVGLAAGDNDEAIDNLTGLWQIHTQLKAEGSPLTDEVKRYNVLASLTKALEFKDVSRYFNNPEEPAELLEAQNELLNQTVLQLQEQNAILQQQADNPLAEAELVKREGEIAIKNAELAEKQRQFDIKMAADLAKLQEEKRQFNVETAQKGRFQQEDTAVELTKIAAKE